MPGNRLLNHEKLSSRYLFKLACRNAYEDMFKSEETLLSHLIDNEAIDYFQKLNLTGFGNLSGLIQHIGKLFHARS
jgi:hypothetical protein